MASHSSEHDYGKTRKAVDSLTTACIMIPFDLETWDVLRKNDVSMQHSSLELTATPGPIDYGRLRRSNETFLKAARLTGMRDRCEAYLWLAQTAQELYRFAGEKLSDLDHSGYDHYFRSSGGMQDKDHTNRDLRNQKRHMQSANKALNRTHPGLQDVMTQLWNTYHNSFGALKTCLEEIKTIGKAKDMIRHALTPVFDQVESLALGRSGNGRSSWRDQPELSKYLASGHPEGAGRTSTFLWRYPHMEYSLSPLVQAGDGPDGTLIGWWGHEQLARNHYFITKVASAVNLPMLSDDDSQGDDEGELADMEQKPQSGSRSKRIKRVTKNLRKPFQSGQSSQGSWDSQQVPLLSSTHSRSERPHASS